MQSSEPYAKSNGYREGEGDKESRSHLHLIGFAGDLPELPVAPGLEMGNDMF
jgi:hypothetical protein